VNNNESVDSRFAYLGLQTNEFDVQTASTVFTQLSSLPGFLSFVPNPEASKKGTLLSFFARTTIPWMLTCEGNEKSRDSVLAIVS